METETSVETEYVASATAQSSIPTALITPGMMRLWYCQRCTRLLLPPGAQGCQNEDGQNFCMTCAPFEVKTQPVTGCFDPAPENRVLTEKVAEPVPSSTTIRVVSRPSSSASRAKAAAAVVVPAPAANNKRLVWIVASSAAAVLILGFAVFGGSAPKNKADESSKSNTSETIEFSKVDIPGSATTAKPEEKKKEKPADTPETVLRNYGSSMTAPVTWDDDAPKTTVKKSNEKKPVSTVQPAPAQGLINSNAVQAASTPPPPNNPPPPQAQVPAKNFDVEFKKFPQLLSDEKFAEAECLIKEFEHILKREHKKTFDAFRNSYNKAFVTFDTLRKDALSQANSAIADDQLSKLEADWTPRLAKGGSAAAAANEVLKAVADNKIRLHSEGEEKAKSVVVGGLDKLADRSKNRLSKVEISKLLTDVKAQMDANPALYNVYFDKWFEIDFDLKHCPPERDIFGMDASGSGTITLNYSFSNAKQFEAWKYKGEGTSSDANGISLDERRASLLLNSTGEHRFDPKAGKTAPCAAIPFCFNSSHWSFGVNATVLRPNTKDKREFPVFGILLSDGKNTIRACVSHTKNNTMEFHARRKDDGADEDDLETAAFPGNPNDPMYFQMEFQPDGYVYLSVPSASKPVHSRTSLKFTPTYIGGFVETGKDATATVAFQSVKLAGTLDPEKIHAIVEKKRVEAQKLFRANDPKAPPLPPAKK